MPLSWARKWDILVLKLEKNSIFGPPWMNMRLQLVPPSGGFDFFVYIIRTG
jgi:hypothetical protein